MSTETHRGLPTGRFLEQSTAFAVRSLRTLRRNGAVVSPLYLLDEPTAGVDLSMVQTFHRAIRDRVRDGGTIVATSHRPVDADLADRIAFVNDGGVTAIGTPRDLLDGVPPVARIVGAGPATDALGSHVVGDRLFYHGDELRGFLTDGVTSADLETATDTDVTVETVEPSYTDAFNYYVHAGRTDE